MIASFIERGVTYSARVLSESGSANPCRVELSANGKVLAVVHMSVRLHGGLLLGGDGVSAERICGGLERSMVELLQGPQISIRVHERGWGSAAPKGALDPNKLYFGDNGDVFCGSAVCSSATAYRTGRTEAGNPVELVTQFDDDYFRKRVGQPVRCQGCEKGFAP